MLIWLSTLASLEARGSSKVTIVSSQKFIGEGVRCGISWSDTKHTSLSFEVKVGWNWAPEGEDKGTTRSSPKEGENEPACVWLFGISGWSLVTPTVKVIVPETLSLGILLMRFKVCVLQVRAIYCNVNGWSDGWMDGWIDGWTDGQTDGWMDGQTDRCVGDVPFKVKCNKVLSPDFNFS